MVYIKELLPNPAGDEAQGEWVRLTNTGEETVSLVGWHISDETSKTYSLSSVRQMTSGEVVELQREATGIALNNNGDTLYLYNQEGVLQDQLAYRGSILEDEIVIAERFIKEAPVRENGLQANALESGIINNTSAVSALLVGVGIAFFAAVASWIILSKDNGDKELT